MKLNAVLRKIPILGKRLDRIIILESGLFDPGYYLERYPDITSNPLEHYLRQGALEMRDPSPFFRTRYYLEKNPDVADSGINPLIHFILWGAREGRDPNPYFDSSFYLESNAGVRASGAHPLTHFIMQGRREGRDQCPRTNMDNIENNSKGQNRKSATSSELPRLYGDLSNWYDLLIPIESLEDEANLYRKLLVEACNMPSRTMLDLGAGAGYTAFFMKKEMELTLVDLSPQMLALSRKINPECEHIIGDMCSVRLGRQFDTIMFNDAIGYVAEEKDLGRAIKTAFVHCVPGGAALFCPDFVRETFTPATFCKGNDDAERSLRCLVWCRDLGSTGDQYIMEMVYLMLRKRDGEVKVVHDQHRMGVFSRAVWLANLERAGFRPRCISVRIGAQKEIVRDVFLGSKPCGL